MTYYIWMILSILYIYFLMILSILHFIWMILSICVSPTISLLLTNKYFAHRKANRCFRNNRENIFLHFINEQRNKGLTDHTAKGHITILHSQSRSREKPRQRNVSIEIGIAQASLEEKRRPLSSVCMVMCFNDSSDRSE